jgi:hypothetical protein
MFVNSLSHQKHGVDIAMISRHCFRKYSSKDARCSQIIEFAGSIVMQNVKGAFPKSEQNAFYSMTD